MTPEHFRELVADAALSPNVHNIQPTRWRLVDENTIAVLASPDRHLAVGDPTGRDVSASHGAAIEGMVIAASEHAIGLQQIAGQGDEVARLSVRGTVRADPLLAFLKTRRTYRGPFDTSRRNEALTAVECLPHDNDRRVITDRKQIERLAKLTDQATLRTFRNRAYRQELTSWMRLTPMNRNWSRDGLNVQAMNMAVPTALAAGAVLSWPLFEILDGAGLAGPLTGEATSIVTSAALVPFIQPIDADPIQTGRAWHRLWLEITRAGLVASPLTVLGDDPVANNELLELLGLSEPLRIVTVMRVGLVDANRLPAPARLPVEDLIIP